VAQPLTKRAEFLLALTRALEQVAEGDYTVRIETGGEEEFEAVAAAFNAMQNRLRDTVSSLELAVRNLHVKQRELVEAEKLASLGRVVAGVAHEINNPLAVINEKAGLLEDLLVIRDDLPSRGEYIALIGGINAQVDRCRGITHRLLGYARRVDLTLEPIDINRMVEEVRGFLEQTIREKQAAVRLDLAPGLPVALSDRIQVEEVLVNLVKNAVQAVPHGGAVVVTTELADHSTLAVTVRDGGPGIPPENIDRLFEPFFTTKEKGVGTGLGLFISHGIMKRLGGSISVQSAPGKGTAFRVELPLRYCVVVEDPGV
jgi:two-component system NtrC family sensor kinase